MTTRHRYSKYKDSGIPWLGEVPEHWEMHERTQRREDAKENRLTAVLGGLAAWREIRIEITP